MKHDTYPYAIARVRGGKHHPQITGIVRFYRSDKGVIVDAEIIGLPKTKTGFFAFHIHDGSNCSGDDFSGTGSHFNPDVNLHPNHAGDLPPLLSDHGRAYMRVLTDRFHIDEIVGRTVVIHNDADDFRSQPSGNAGTKIACGMIRKGRPSPFS